MDLTPSPLHTIVPAIWAIRSLVKHTELSSTPPQLLTDIVIPLIRAIFVMLWTQRMFDRATVLKPRYIMFSAHLPCSCDNIMLTLAGGGGTTAFSAAGESLKIGKSLKEFGEALFLSA